MSDSRESTLLPPNATALERALEGATRRLSAVPVDTIHTLWTPWTCPAHVLPWLAWAVSVDDWDDDWPEATQRAIVATSGDIHRHKGTLGAVHRAMAAIGADDAEITEWFQDDAIGRGRFRVTLSADHRSVATAMAQWHLKSSIDAAKRVSAHYHVSLKEEAALALALTQAGLGQLQDLTTPRKTETCAVRPGVTLLRGGAIGQRAVTETVFYGRAITRTATLSANTGAQRVQATDAVRVIRYKAPPSIAQVIPGVISDSGRALRRAGGRMDGWVHDRARCSAPTVSAPRASAGLALHAGVDLGAPVTLAARPHPQRGRVIVANGCRWPVTPDAEAVRVIRMAPPAGGVDDWTIPDTGTLRVPTVAGALTIGHLADTPAATIRKRCSVQGAVVAILKQREAAS